jgi:hypothetical protein
MALGVNGYTGDFAEIHSRWQLREVRNGIEGNFRYALLPE